MTREEAIKRLEIHKSKSIYVDSIAEAIDMAIEALKAQDWIPVSERLPVAWEPVLVTDIRRNVNMLKWSHKEYWVDCDEEEFYGYNDWVIAWMPLPKPYKAESEDKE